MLIRVTLPYQQNAESTAVNDIQPKHDPTSNAALVLPGLYRNNKPVSPQGTRTVHYKRVVTLGNKVGCGDDRRRRLPSAGCFVDWHHHGENTGTATADHRRKHPRLSHEKVPRTRRREEMRGSVRRFPAAVVAVGTRHADA